MIKTDRLLSGLSSSLVFPGPYLTELNLFVSKNSLTLSDYQVISVTISVSVLQPDGNNQLPVKREEAPVKLKLGKN